MLDEGVAEGDASVQHVDHRDRAFRAFQRVAQTTGGIEIDGNDLRPPAAAAAHSA